MSAQDPRYDEIMKALSIIQTKLPNGELEVIKKSIQSLEGSIQSLEANQKTIKEDLDYLKKRLFNPDDGVIVRINKNTEYIERFEEIADEMPDIKNQLKNLESWQGNVTKALWIVYTSVIGIIISLVIAAFRK
jgi:archaellum component FlaC